MVRYLTGFQPTGALHIGNYFGALRPAIELQEKGEAFYFIADYHALNTIHDPAVLREHVRSVAIDSLACGLEGLFFSAIRCAGSHGIDLDPK
jgi:tryptophanyl-tRNA synthetase